jgi:hypothetical protein
MIPEPSAPRPVPLVHPYFDMRRSAKPCWPGRRDLDASSAGWFSSPDSAASAFSNSASELGISVGAGGKLYLTGARDISPATTGSGGGGGGGDSCLAGGIDAG